MYGGGRKAKRAAYRGRGYRRFVAGKQVKMKKIVIGLTGGIGTGKSTVAGMLFKLGAKIADCDLIAREVIEPGGDGDRVLRSFFPDVYSGLDGALNRAKLKELIFEDETARQKLDFVMHPLIYDRCERLIGETSEGIIVLEAALLFEAGFEDLCNITVCTVCDEYEQIRRVINRDCIDEALAKKIISSQAPQSEKAGAADIVINTSVSLSGLEESVKKLYFEINGKLNNR
jgi:dephospho-CoA kinase